MPKTKIAVRYYGMLHDIVGKRSETFVIEETDTALDLMKLMAAKNGKKFQDFVFDSKGNIRPGLAFAIDGISVEKSSLEQKTGGDIKEFVILPPISGGVVPLNPFLPPP
jgi:molybdopterin converting factor small subunit